MRRVLGAAALVVVAFAPVVPAASEALVEAGYVVVLRPSAADVDETAARLSGSVSAELGDIYETALDGFSVTATTQEAAAMLNVSRPFVIKEINAGRVPCRMVNRHRRIMFVDLVKYQAQQKKDSAAALKALSRVNREIGQEL